MSKLIEIKNLYKSFSQGKEKIEVIKDLNFSVEEGETISLMGESGSGKSTLLQIMSGLMNYDSGDVIVCGQNLSKLSDRKITKLRGKYIGFVYQYHHLLADFNALENVMMPQLIIGVSKKLAKKRAAELLEKLGLSNRANHRPGELSGGQQQRVAIARALANFPKIVFADEPTGNLDTRNGNVVLSLLLDLARENKTSLVIATHSEIISSKTAKVFSL